MSLPLLATVGLSCAVAGGVAALSSLRRRDTRDDDAEYTRLAALQPTQPARHDPAALAACPEPVRRYFGHAIAPGAPLWRVAMIDMRGQFSLGTRETGNLLRPLIKDGFKFPVSGEHFVRDPGLGTGARH